MTSRDSSSLTRSKRLARATVSHIQELVKSDKFIADLTALNERVLWKPPHHPASAGDVTCVVCGRGSHKRDLNTEQVQGWLLADVSQDARAARLACMLAFARDADDVDSRLARVQACDAIVTSIRNCVYQPRYEKVVERAEVALGASARGRPVAVAKGWANIRESFDVIADRFRREAHDGELLILALEHELPLDIPRLLELVSARPAEGGFACSDYLRDALCHDVWLRREEVPVTYEQFMAVSQLRQIARIQGVDYFGDDDDQARLWLRGLADKAGAPRGFSASAAGFPPSFEAGGKRPYVDGSQGDEAEDEDDTELVPFSLEVLHREIADGRCSPALPHTSIARIARAVARVSDDHRYLSLARDWRLLRFRRAPSDDELERWKDTIVSRVPPWHLYSLEKGLREHARRRNDRELYLPVCVRALKKGAVSERELIEPVLGPVRDFFAASEHREKVLGE